MLTTVVGSYPSAPQEPSSLGSKISRFIGSYDPYEPAVQNAVKMQIKAGIDLISDGQVRGGMIEIFSKVMPGMVWEDGNSKIKGKIIPMNYSIGAEDLKLALKTAKKISTEFNNSKPLIAKGEFQEGFKGVKGIITGPTTLVLSSRLEGFYTHENRAKAMIDLAHALRREADFLEAAGASLIQVDEPFLSTGIADIKTAYKAIKIISNGRKIPLAMHVCGDISQIFGELLKFPIDLIDCEFAGIPSNLQVLEDHPLRDKKLGFGCLDSKSDNVESPREIRNFIEKGIELVGKENMIADPDCGMRMRQSEAAFLKLKNMKEAVRWLS